MSSVNSASGMNPDQPVENLHKRWARQADAMLSQEAALFALADTLPTYGDLLKDVRLKDPYSKASATLDELPRLKEAAIASLNSALDALRTLENESGFNFQGELNRFTAIRDQLKNIDCTSLPSSTPFQSDFPNHVAGLTSLRDNFAEYRDLQGQSRYMTNGDQALRSLHNEMPKQAGVLGEAAENVRIISRLMTVAHGEAVKKMKPILEKVGDEVIQLSESCIAADRLVGERNLDVDIAPSVSALRRYGANLQKGNSEFLTPVEYRRNVKGYLDQAYGEREPYATQLQKEVAAPPAQESVEMPQETTATAWSIWQLFRRK